MWRHVLHQDVPFGDQGANAISITSFLPTMTVATLSAMIQSAHDYPP